MDRIRTSLSKIESIIVCTTKISGQALIFNCDDFDKI